MERIIKKCECGQLISATSKSQLDYNIGQHLIGQKHMRIMNLGEFEKCKSCGKMEKYLHLHHIDYNHSNNNTNNLIVLCKQCHDKLHSGKRDKQKGDKAIQNEQ